MEQNEVPGRVYVYTGDDRLRRALLGRLRKLSCLEVSGGDTLPEPGLFRVVLAPNVDLSPEECATLVRDGAQVVVLAAVMRPEDEARYLACGVSGYVAMNIDTRELQGELVRVASNHHGQPCTEFAVQPLS